MNRYFAPLIVALVALVPAAVGQGKIDYDGSEVFRFALDQNGLKPLTRVQQAMESPRISMIIAFGDTAKLNQHFSATFLWQYLQRGGAVLIATDQRTVVAGRDWGLSTFGIFVTGEPLTADQQDGYKSLDGRPREDRPFVWPRPAFPGEEPSPWDLFKGVPANGDEAIATDRPSEMLVGNEPQGFRRTYLADYPDSARRVRDGNPLKPPRNHFAISVRVVDRRDQYGPGRMIVLADHSVFVNGMSGVVKDPTQANGYYFNNGNWAFANRTIKWLQGGFEQPRTHCLFIHDGEIKDQFAVSLPGPRKQPVPDIPPEVLANILLNHSNGVINEFQEKNFFNRMIEGWLGLPRIMQLFLIAVTVLFLYSAFRWLVRTYRKVEPGTVLPPGVQERMMPRGSVLRQRNAAQLEIGNLYEAARRRVRDRFDVLGGRPGPNGQMPPLLIANDYRTPEPLRQSVRWLWAIGYGESPVAVPPAEWDQVNVTLERVTAQAARGAWSFGQEA
ncbi:MAG TPA: hypothetical protein VKE40_02350 [Gemmataceae bacterium]|nr:hypothetical protein [Gemmataceae bacterium]